MKKNLLFVIVALSALASVSCNKENYSGVNEGRTIMFTASEVETKTVFGELDAGSYPTLWTAGQLKISANFGTGINAAVTPSADAVTADFTANFTAALATPCTFYSVSPAAASVSFNSTYKSGTVDIAATQTPTASSVDESAQVLVGKTAAFDAVPSTVQINYSHLTAYGKLSITGLPADATLESVDLVATKNWVGRFYYYFEDNGTNVSGTTAESSASNAINVITSSATDIWFACAPVDLGGTQLTVKANTTSGVFEKAVTVPDGKLFEAGKVAKFSVNMTGVTPTEDVIYTLVTSLSDLTVGSEVIITNFPATKAMSTQNTNNRSAADVAVSGNTIVNPAAAVAVFTASAGTSTNTIAFNDASGYLYAAGGTSNNYLRTKSTLDLTSSWTLDVAESGVATIKCASTSVSRNWIRYNSTATLFSCYASGQENVAIYKKNGSGTTQSIFVVLPKINVNSDNPLTLANTSGTGTITYTIDNPTSASITAQLKDPSATWISNISTATPGQVTFDVSAQETAAPQRNAIIVLSYDTATDVEVTVNQEPGEGGALAPLTMNLFANQATVSGTGASQTATWTSGDITVTAVRGTSTTNFNSSDNNLVRLYKDWTITVSSAAHTISSVEFTCTSTAYATALSANTFTNGTAAASETLVTVSGVNASSTSATLSAQVRVSSIKIIYN